MVVKCWNRLPIELVAAPTLGRFEVRLDDQPDGVENVLLISGTLD